MSWQFSLLYLHHLITYSYTQYHEMLYGLFSLQTNLHISLHYQSDVLQHNSTKYEELLFLSDILVGASSYMWNWFGVVVFQRFMVDWGYVCHGYMCIFLYVKLIWCSGVPEIYGWLLGGQWHSNNNKNNNKWINVHKLWNHFVHISIVVTLSCCCSCSACLALAVLISHEFIPSRCGRVVLTWTQLAGGLCGVEREREREREREWEREWERERVYQ